MKYLIPLNESSSEINMPNFSSKESILCTDEFWMVFVFISSYDNRRFKSMSSSPETFQNLTNIIRGGMSTSRNEIAGLFKNKEDAMKLYDLLDYPEEK